MNADSSVIEREKLKNYIAVTDFKEFMTGRGASIDASTSAISDEKLTALIALLHKIYTN